MSCVTIQLGQCGNQLGRVLNDTLFTHLAGESSESSESSRRRRRALARYFSEAASSEGEMLGMPSDGLKYHARSVLVDMETKVVNKCMSHVGVVARPPTGRTKASSTASAAARQRATTRTRTSRGAQGGARRPLASASAAPSSSSASAASAASAAGIFSSSSTTTQSTWTYRANNSFVRHSGSGNNWAAGYITHAQGPHGAGARVMELVRREAEQSDYGVGCFLLLQSLAGGTGSGVGARVSELLRDEYGRRSTIANSLVAPYSAGEVSVQLYNSLLTLTSVSSSSDAVFLFRNDQIQSICKERKRLAHPSFDDLNTIIAHQLSSTVLLPSTSWRSSSKGGGGGDGSSNSKSRKEEEKEERGLEDAVRHLCAHPSYRMLGIKMLPFGAFGDQLYDTSTWKGTLRRLHQMQMDPEAYMEDKIDWSLSSGTTRRMIGGGSSGGGDGSESGSGGSRGGSRGGLLVQEEKTRLGSKGVNRTLAACLVLRGIDTQATLEAVVRDEKEGQEQYRYPPQRWTDTPGMFLPHLFGHEKTSLNIRFDQFSFNFWERSASIVSNSQTVVTPFNRILEGGREMFHANAYVHQYAEHGFIKDDLKESFEKMAQLVHDYSSL